MHSIHEGEALVYFDAGCEILPENKKTFSKILDYLNHHDQMVWSYAILPVLNLVFWSKQTLLDRAESEFGLTNLPKIPQVWAGNIGLVKTKKSASLLDDWWRLATTDSYSLIDDTPAPTPQRYLFFEHRCDQAILSMLIAAHGIEGCGSAADYEYGREHIVRWPALLHKPFLAMRNRTPHSQVPRSFLLQIRKYLLPGLTGLERGWSHDRALELTLKHRHQLRLLGLD